MDTFIILCCNILTALDINGDKLGDSEIDFDYGLYVKSMFRDLGLIMSFSENEYNQFNIIDGRRGCSTRL